MSDSTTIIRTYKVRLFPSRTQARDLRRVLEAARGLYNMALAERKYAYERDGRSVSQAELYALAKHYRRTFLYADQMFSQTAQSVVEQVAPAFEPGRHPAIRVSKVRIACAASCSSSTAAG